MLEDISYIKLLFNRRENIVFTFISTFIFTFTMFFRY